jgi:putative PIG3 family NAD(P)H quinone oxidoreductase
LAGGGYAAFSAVPAVQVLPAPAGLDMIAAAALPEAAFTVWTNLMDRARLVAGERLLVHGGASGIGTMAIQLARALGVRVFATAGTPEKCAVCEKLGAERAVDYRSADFVAEIEALAGGVDVILDMVGGDYLARNLELLATEGRLVQIAFLGGAHAEVDLSAVMRKRLTITGSTLRARAIEDKAAIARAVGAGVWPLVEAGEVVPVIDSVFPLAEASAAHRRMEAGEHIGKIVLRV